MVERFPLLNAAASPVEFESDPRSMLEAMRSIDRLGLEILAIYHSHPTSAPVPSKKDLARNYSPDVLNLIVSLQNQTPEMRAWWLTEESFQAGKWELID